ncbi:bis(5'-nucleosyl)-tetraphosphatase (symmetrical) YqeK [Denitrobacterium detoxificans]|jgi:predicted HD superfamily hydrolase involved in NAD metabolism|uniref:bis(5'-nucleosyl)-tetraphosphatase (symmetrical) YqeK n=1 Tax=Denitrobacterium detoxificans TaxID=79604 RepID=UPI0026EAC5DC|nr:bis(5'-nucleosyl)-tetraphosphatase (symmetrical) YqeK [Denitrobacterium detoxificans]
MGKKKSKKQLQKELEKLEKKQLAKKKNKKARKAAKRQELTREKLIELSGGDLPYQPASKKVFGKKNYKRMKVLLAARVGKKRYKHSVGVAKTAKKLAKLYGYNPKVARMAGILHDWDKGLGVYEIRERAQTLGVDLDPQISENMPWLLHGPTAAAALRLEYPEFGEEVFQAIARHTSGAAEMSPLDCIIYVADIIEPNRTFGDMKGIKRLRKEVGKVPLEQLYFDAFKYTFTFLVSRDRQLYPETVDIWNSLMWKYGFVRTMKF